MIKGREQALIASAEGHPCIHETVAVNDNGMRGLEITHSSSEMGSRQQSKSAWETHSGYLVCNVCKTFQCKDRDLTYLGRSST